MGGCSSSSTGNVDSDKINEYKRERVYKRVSLIEARKLFAELTGPRRFAKAFYDDPISLNFTLSLKRQNNQNGSSNQNAQNGLSDRNGLDHVSITLKSSNNIELDGSKSDFWLSGILGGSIATIIPGSYFLGLDKAQYDALYSSIPSSTVSIPTTEAIIGNNHL